MSLLSAMQCRDDVLENYSYRGGWLGIGAVSHQTGTIRFGTGAATSALDLDCRSHHDDNLHVADSSFFVSSSEVNPTLTIIANALRVAGRIADRLGVGQSVVTDHLDSTPAPHGGPGTKDLSLVLPGPSAEPVPSA